MALIRPLIEWWAETSRTDYLLMFLVKLLLMRYSFLCMSWENKIKSMIYRENIQNYTFFDLQLKSILL